MARQRLECIPSLELCWSWRKPSPEGSPIKSSKYELRSISTVPHHRAKGRLKEKNCCSLTGKNPTILQKVHHFACCAPKKNVRIQKGSCMGCKINHCTSKACLRPGHLACFYVPTHLLRRRKKRMLAEMLHWMQAKMLCFQIMKTKKVKWPESTVLPCRKECENMLPMRSFYMCMTCDAHQGKHQHL